MQNRDTTPIGFLFWFLLACTMIRFVFVFTTPPLGAEIYYWEWSKHLAWGYFDHPPLVAYLIALFTRIGSDSAIPLKLAAICAGLLTTMIFYHLARDMFGKAVAATAACVIQVIPFFAAVNVFTVPDTPLGVFWTLTLFYVYRATKEDNGRYWYAVGVALGLAMLSKYHAFLLFPCVFLFLVLSSRSRKWLIRKEPYVGAAIAVALFSPNLFWNVNRGLITFRFLLGERHDPSEFSLEGAAYFVAGFVVFLSPLFAVLVLRLIPQLFMRAFARSDDRYLLLLATSIPVLFFFGALSPFIKISSHWPAVGYLSLSLAAVAALLDPPAPRSLYFTQRFPKMSIAFSAVILLVAHIGPVVIMALPPAITVGGFTIPVASNRVYKELHGWNELGAAVQDEMKNMPDAERTFVITNSYRFASQIRFYTGSTVIAQTTGQKSPKQYGLWHGRYDLEGWDAIFIDKKSRERYREGLREQFNEVKEFEPMEIKKHGRVIRVFYIVKCFGYK